MLIDGFTLFGSWPGLPYDHPADQLVNGVERYKLDRACIVSSTGIFLDAAAGNQATWQASRQDPRLIPIGVADPRLNGIEQVNYCKEQGFRILALFPVWQNWSVDNIAATRVLQRINELQMPVMVEAHREGDASAILRQTVDTTMPLILLDVSLTTLTEAIMAVQQRPNTYLATRLLCGGDTIEYLVETIGADKLIFTSGFPINCFSSAYLTAKFASITDAQRSAILGGTIARLFGW